MVKITFNPSAQEKPNFQIESDCENAHALIKQFAFMVGMAIHYIDGKLEKLGPDNKFPIVMLEEILDALELIEDHADELEVSDHD